MFVITDAGSGHKRIAGVGARQSSRPVVGGLLLTVIS